jgi:hypothetical protein
MDFARRNERGRGVGEEDIEAPVHGRRDLALLLFQEHQKPGRDQASCVLNAFVVLRATKSSVIELPVRRGYLAAVVESKLGVECDVAVNCVSGGR